LEAGWLKLGWYGGELGELPVSVVVAVALAVNGGLDTGIG
jgi:hypothetical protein